MAAPLPYKPTLHRIATMIESGLLLAEHFIPWADARVMSLDAPPGWLLELCTTPDGPSAARVLYDSAATPPFEPLDEEAQTDDFVACLLLRYRRGDFTWATFLQQAGAKLDAANGRRPCEALYALLTELERREYSTEVERTQRSDVERDFEAALERVGSLHATFAANAHEPHPGCQR